MSNFAEQHYLIFVSKCSVYGGCKCDGLSFGDPGSYTKLVDYILNISFVLIKTFVDDV